MYQNLNPNAANALGIESELAEDWALFQAVESGEADHLYRTWETDVPVIVAGRHRALADDVVLEACRADGMPIVRRPSGGGTVVLGPGCLNYAVALSLVSRPDLIDVGHSFAVILDVLIAAVGVKELERTGTDVALGDRKVSGNAHRRGRRALLHHGTMLYAFDPALAERYLEEPARQPPYRRGRSHREFLTDVSMPVERLRERIERGLASLAAAPSPSI